MPQLVLMAESFNGWQNLGSVAAAIQRKNAAIGADAAIGLGWLPPICFLAKEARWL